MTTYFFVAASEKFLTVEEPLEEILNLSDKTKTLLYRALQRLEDDVRRNKNSRRFY